MTVLPSRRPMDRAARVLALRGAPSTRMTRAERPLGSAVAFHDALSQPASGDTHASEVLTLLPGPRRQTPSSHRCRRRDHADRFERDPLSVYRTRLPQPDGPAASSETEGGDEAHRTRRRTRRDDALANAGRFRRAAHRRHHLSRAPPAPEFRGLLDDGSLDIPADR